MKRPANDTTAKITPPTAANSINPQMMNTIQQRAMNSIGGELKINDKAKQLMADIMNLKSGRNHMMVGRN